MTASTYFFNYDTPEIQDYIQAFKDDRRTAVDKAVALYLKVRDGFRYNPYHISFRKEDYRANLLVQKTEGHCIDKSIVYISGLRALGIPAKIRLAKVENHIGVERLVEKFGSNVMTPHGMVDVFLEGKWVKCSPAFNKELCAYCNVEPLDFDGRQDSVFQEYDKEGGDFMHYLEDYGAFDDLPMNFIVQNMKENYPKVRELYDGLDKIEL